MLKIQGSKTPVVQRPEYTIYIQDAEGKKFLHLDFRGPWSKSVFDKGQEDMLLIKTIFGSLGIDFLWVLIPEDDKLLKFEEMFGLREVGRYAGYILMHTETN